MQTINFNLCFASLACNQRWRGVGSTACDAERWQAAQGKIQHGAEIYQELGARTQEEDCFLHFLDLKTVLMT